MCGFLEIRLEKNEKKKSKIMSVTERPIDRSIGRPVDFFCLFFLVFFTLVSLLLEYSYFDPFQYFISRHTFDRERERGKREREGRRWRRRSLGRNDGSDQSTKDCFVLSLFILKRERLPSLLSFVYHLSPDRSLFYT